MITRDELRKRLPYGAGKEIAQKLGISSSAVSNFLNGVTNNERIEFAVLEYLIEHEKKRRELYSKLMS